MGPTPILEMARAYGLRPRLWLLNQYKKLVPVLSRFCSGPGKFMSGPVGMPYLPLLGEPLTGAFTGKQKAMQEGGKGRGNYISSPCLM